MYIFKLCAAILQVFDILEIGPLYHGHTQLNVCEKEELQCFLYLIQIFGIWKEIVLHELPEIPNELDIMN